MGATHRRHTLLTAAAVSHAGPQKENKKTGEHSDGREDPAAEAIPPGAAAAVGTVAAVMSSLGQERAGLIGMSAEQGAGVVDEGRHQCFDIDDAM